MKTFIFSLFSVFVLLASCKKMLEEHPTDRLFSSSFYKTKSDAVSAVNAIYSPLRRNYAFHYGSQFTAAEDYATGKGPFYFIGQYQGYPSSIITKTDLEWDAFYQTINASNIVLKYVPPITMPDAEKNALLGEARFLRALSYYNLVRSWGGVPLRSQPTESTDAIGGKRAPVPEVYNFIIKDLEFAEASLPAKQSLAGKPTKWAAKTMLADVYLTNGKWTEARDKANEVIISGAYSLVPVKKDSDFELIFGPEAITSSEDVFSIKFSRTQGSSIPQFYHLSNSAYARSGFGTFFGFPKYPLLKNWDNKDLRKTYNLYTQYPTRTGKIIKNAPDQPIRFKKFVDLNAAPGHGNDFPVYRYPDALLIYAEAASQANGGPTPMALERLNMVHRRAYGYNPAVPSVADFTLATAPTGQSFRNLVLTERAYEFLCEGKRWFDLIRMGTLKQTIKEAKGLDVSDSHLLFPIPEQEIANNPDINPDDQNP
ncbi:MAG: RagB/SusD family nutrient uptake outer membrane protein [Daejeonella sp.]